MHACNALCKSHGCWAACFICGFEYPIDVMTLHYKKERYVCCECDDCPSWSDFMEDLEVPEEETCNTEGQQVTDQGGEEGLSSISNPDNVSDSGGVIDHPVEPPPATDECNEPWNYIGRGIYYGGPLLGVDNRSHIDGSLRAFTSIPSTGGVLDSVSPNFRQPMTSRITIKKIVARICIDSGTFCTVAIEAYKDGIATGFITAKGSAVDDIVVGEGSVVYEIGEHLSWQPRFYDIDDVEQTIYPGATVADYPNLTKGILVAFEYDSDDGYFIQPFGDYAFYSLSNTDPSGFNRPIAHPAFTNLDGEFATDATGPVNKFPNGVGFNAEWLLKRWTFEGWLVINSQGTSHYLRSQDETTLTSVFQMFQDDPGDINSGPIQLQGPYSEEIDVTVPAISVANLDTEGRVQVIEDAGEVTSFLGLNTIIMYSMCYAYKFTEHPHSQYITAEYTNHSSVGVGAIRRVPLCGSYGSSQSAVRAATPLVSKGRFHHFAFWTQESPAIGNLRCQLLVDNMVLFTLTIPAGNRITLDAEMSVCVDGQTAWWEFTKMDGSSEPLEVGVSCLYGPEGL